MICTRFIEIIISQQTRARARAFGAPGIVAHTRARAHSEFAEWARNEGARSAADTAEAGKVYILPAVSASAPVFGLCVSAQHNIHATTSTTHQTHTNTPTWQNKYTFYTLRGTATTAATTTTTTDAPDR